MDCFDQSSLSLQYLSSKTMQECSMESIIENYRLLSNQSSQVRENANLFLMGIVDLNSAWSISQKMISEAKDQTFQFLGSQILYQKIERELHLLSVQTLQQLKTFLFTKLDDSTIESMPVINRLSSSAALVGCSLFLDHWPTFVDDLITFMDKSKLNLRNGLVVLEKIPEELRNNNHMRNGVKNVIKEKFLERQDIMSRIFVSVLTFNQSYFTKITLEAVESWIKVGFNILNQTELIALILKLSLTNPDLFEECSKILGEGAKTCSQLKYNTIGFINIDKDKASYSDVELKSVSSIIEFLRANRQQLFNLKELDVVETYVGIVRVTMTSFGFLIGEDVGLELIGVIMQALEQKDLKLSYNTFEYWLQFLQKQSTIKLPQNINENIAKIIDHLFVTILSKNYLESENMLYEYKEDETIDDICVVNFGDYRKQSQHLFRSIYEYYVKKKGNEGSDLVFSKLSHIVSQGSRGIELAIYGVRSLLEALISQYDHENQMKILRQITPLLAGASQIPPAIAGSFLSLIRDCAKEIAGSQLLIPSMKIALNFIDSEKLCHYSLYSLQSLIDCMGVCDKNLVEQLIKFYRGKNLKEIIFEKFLECLMGVIGRLPQEDSVLYVNGLIDLLRSKFAALNNAEDSNLHMVLIELKSFLSAYEHFDGSLKKHLKPTFLLLANDGLALVQLVLRSSIGRGVKFTPTNEIGLSALIYKISIRIVEKADLKLINIENYLKVMNIAVEIVKAGKVKESVLLQYDYVIDIVNKTIGQFVGVSSPLLNSWLQTNLPIFSQFFFGYIAPPRITMSLDPDLIRMFYGIQENLILYSSELYISQADHQKMLEIALNYLSIMVEKNLQRKLSVYLLLCLEAGYQDKFVQILKGVFDSIPRVNHICFITISKILSKLFDQIEASKKQMVLQNLMEVTPFERMKPENRKLLLEFGLFAFYSKTDRYIKGFLIDLSDCVNKGLEGNDRLNVEMRFRGWMREFKKNGS